MSQSPDGDFFDPEVGWGQRSPQVYKSQSPDGDFFDPENEADRRNSMAYARHSPLTGIFLIRRLRSPATLLRSHLSHSPLTGIFLIRSYKALASEGGLGLFVTVP